ncbi:MAG: hypothetical protein QXR48_04410 [Candidatus Woesearchaeota archaeon]
MAKRKLSADEQGLDELLAQAFNRNTTIGKNIMHLRERFSRTNDTMGLSMLRVLGYAIRSKGVRNFGGEITVKVGTMRRGELLAQPEKGKRRERIAYSNYSGKQLVNVYPISYSLRTDGETIVPAGYTLGTRLDFEDVIGPQQVDTLLAYSRLLNDPDMRNKLKRQKRSEAMQRSKEQKDRLDDLLSRMPAEFKQRAIQRKIDLTTLQNTEILKVGGLLAEEKWSALLWALDPGKHRNVYNWFREKAAKDDLPGDVREAWIYINKFPHLIDDYQIVLLGAYRMQEMPMPRKGIAGDIAEELKWLATSKEAEKARTLYGKEIDLSLTHEPAKFYTGNAINTNTTIEKMLDEPYWTIADREGILRKFPLVQFREEWNKQIIDKLFGNANAFYSAMNILYAIKQEDAKKIAEAPKPEDADTILGKDYAFVKEVFERMTKGEQNPDDYRRENLLRRTSIHKAKEEFHKLYVIAQKARLQEVIPDAMRQEYVTVTQAQESTGIPLSMTEIAERVQKGLWIYRTAGMRKQLSQARLTEKHFKELVTKMPELLQEAQYGLVRKDYVRETTKGQGCILQKLYEMVKEARRTNA